MLSVENLKKSFGRHILFEGVSFKINTRERVGLVGRNGHGKTTLFRLIVGEEFPDSGTITKSGHYRIGYVRQRLEFTEDTVLKEGIKWLPQEEAHCSWKVEKILSGLGFFNHDFHRHPGEFSGGFQIRLNFAKVLVSNPDLLLLDEPTNYLDITSIRWLKQFLINWPHELILITHDRNFMDELVTHTMGIHHKKIRKIEGNTEKFYMQIAKEEEIYEKTRINDERRRREIEQFINRFRAKARLANLVQSRIKTLEKRDKREKLEKLKTLDFFFRSLPYFGKYLLNARNITFFYHQDNPLIQDLNFTIRPRDRICVVGKNGKGKTTLLKLLADEISPQNGSIERNPSVVMGFFEQTNTRHLIETRTIEEEIIASHPDIDKQTVRTICGSMLFDGDKALKKIGMLSGGEKSRVMFGKLLAKPIHLLLLDEVTNHLDMESCDALLAALDNFKGALVMVTHNEMFLHTIAEQLVVFKKDRVYLFNGSYQEFLEKDGWEDEALSNESGKGKTAKKKILSKMGKKETRRKRSEIITKRGNALKPLEQRMTKLEKEIEAHETSLKEMQEAIVKASQAQDGQKIVEISKAMHNCQSAIDIFFDELEHVSNTLEKERAHFDERLKELQRLENF